MSSAIFGAVYNACASFAFTVPTGTGSTATSLARGSYYLYATVDTWVRIGGVSDVASVPATRSAGGAAASPNGTFLVPAFQVTPLDITNDSYFSVIATVGGTLNVVGPLMGK